MPADRPARAGPREGLGPARPRRPVRAGGDFDRAKGYYERLRAGGGASAGLADRLAAVTDPGTLPEIVKVVEAPGGRVRLTFYAPSLEADLVTAVKASWLRVTTALGNDSLGNDLSVVIYPHSGPSGSGPARAWGHVKGFYLHGRVSLFQTPRTPWSSGSRRSRTR